MARSVSEGKTVAIVDLTRGEMGTRGSAEIRAQEAADAARVLGVTARENLDFGDTLLANRREFQLRVIEMLRKYRPRIVLATALSDRHPDHGQAAELVTASCFLAGLVRIETLLDGELQAAWRPRAVYHYVQAHHLTPSLVVDISDHFDKKMDAIRCFRSQLYNPESSEPDTILSQPWFIKQLEARAIEYGWAIGAKYGEAFLTTRPVGVANLSELL